MSEVFVDFYAMLEINFAASFEEIKAAYRLRAKQYHPDLNPEDKVAAASRFRLIKEAYDTLFDPAARERYNRIWREKKNVSSKFDDAPETMKHQQVSDVDWEFACKYFPDLRQLSEKLQNFGGSIELQWKNRVFFDKSFSCAAELACEAEEVQLGKMVGASKILRMVAKDALLAQHNVILSELINALRVLGSSATENVLEKICELSICEDHNIPGYDAPPMRVERYRDEDILILSDLTCLINPHRPRFKYLFAAMKAVDDYVDRGMRIDTEGDCSFFSESANFYSESASRSRRSKKHS